MNRKLKPTPQRPLDKFLSCVIVILSVAVSLIVGLFVDLAVNDLNMDEPPSKWWTSFMVVQITLSPIYWALVHNFYLVTYYFKQYRPWKKHDDACDRYYDNISLNQERRLSESFITQVRRK